MIFQYVLVNPADLPIFAVSNVGNEIGLCFGSFQVFYYLVYDDV